MTKWLAYQGTAFTIEWYVDERGRSEAWEYYQQQPFGQQRRLLNLFRVMGDQGKIFDETKFRNEGDGIYAFKPQPDRYLCFFFRGRKIVITNAFMKKANKLPQNEKERARNAYANYVKRVNGGVYYEEKN